MKKQFSIPVSMKVNQEQFDYLKKELIKLGYKITLETDIMGDSHNHPNILVIQYTSNNNFTNAFNYRDLDYFIQEYNPELFLALASMTSNEEFFVGESIIRVKDEHGILKVGDLGIITNVINRGHDFGITIQNDEKEHMHSSDNIRKATKEEIITNFLKSNTMELKELPKKWYITTTEESNTAVCDFYDKYNKSITDRSLGNYFCMDEHGVLKGWMYRNQNYKKGYTEITFEDFKRLVLKENSMDKRLIGYKLKEDCRQFEKAAFAIINVHSVEGVTKFTCLNGTHFTKDSNYFTWLKEANVLDLWFQPVYEDIKKDVQVSVRASKTLVFTISKDHEGYVTENQENKKVSIVSLVNMIHNGFELDGYNAYKVVPVTFSMGCVKNIYTSDIEKVIEAYDKFWGTYHHDSPF
jgi:hypothetical protein